jgi:hypothetical protein
MPKPAATKPKCQLTSVRASRRQRRDERAEVDAHVEDREAGVAAFVVAAIQRADDRR